MFEAGQMLKFKNPEADETDLRFFVIEDRGDRVLVRHYGSLRAIPPTFVYLATDMENAA